MTRKIGWLFLMVLLCSCNFSNKSTEEDLYYEKMKAYPNYISFDEPTKEEILNFNSEYYQLIHSDFYVPYDGKFLLTPYQDSIYLQERIKLSAAIDSDSKLRYKSEKEYN
ncbi:MAG: hypothetical protein LIO93_00060, partial [Bacteroidales bacterium]|nr:hypothetical protein [Bacteroidales bacterium]